MSMREDGDTAARVELAVRILGLAYTLLCLLFLLWVMIPEHRRKLMMMRMAETTRKAAGQAACRAGHLAMGREISGLGESYSVPLALSVMRDKAAAAVERMRYSA